MSDDEELFKNIYKDVKNIKTKKRHQDQSDKVIIIKKRDRKEQRDSYEPVSKDQYPLLIEGSVASIDKITADKFLRGQMDIAASIDLHGKTEDAAYGLLQDFIENAYLNNKRCIVVITGKGSAGSGLLKSQFPRWLNYSYIRKYVLSFTQAQSKHGGEGAFYVLVRKNRGS